MGVSTWWLRAIFYKKSSFFVRAQVATTHASKRNKNLKQKSVLGCVGWGEKVSEASVGVGVLVLYCSRERGGGLFDEEAGGGGGGGGRREVNMIFGGRNSHQVKKNFKPPARRGHTL